MGKNDSGGREPSVGSLARCALHAVRASTREGALAAVARRAGGEHVWVFQQALLDPEPGVRAAAVDALGEIGGAPGARALSVALGDEDPRLRERAVYALGRTHCNEALDPLRRACSDSRAAVQDAAILVLGDLRKFLQSCEPGRKRGRTGA